MTDNMANNIAVESLEPEAVKDFVRAYFKAVNEERWDDVLALYHEDATLHVPAVRTKNGHDRIRPFYEDIGKRFEKHVAEIRLVLAEGSLDNAIAAATVAYDGVDRNGKPVEVFAADNFRIEDGRIRELRIIFDTGRM
jgi:ketosteroid isomerase-like protein